MQVSVEKVSPVECRLTIVVPANVVEEAYTRQIDAFAQKAKIDGFRPGKAPMSFIQQRFGADARKEALSEVIQKTLYEAITEKQLRPLNNPRIEPKTILSNQPLEYTASFEILPEIGNVSFSMDSVEKLNVAVTDEDIGRVLEQLTKQYTKWEPIQRAAELKDRVVIDYYAIFDGKSDEANKLQNIPLELGSNMMLPGFEAGLVGAKAGEERTLKLAFPDDFAVAERAGKPIEFVVTLKEVYKAEVPAIDANFVQRLGVKSGKEEELRSQIRMSLEQERDRLVKEKLKEQLFSRLLEQNPLEVPASLVANEAKAIHDEVYPAHQPHDHHQHSDQEMSSFNEVAKKRVALGLLISEYAKTAQIKADKARVNARIQEIASIYESPEEVVQWLSSKERIGGIEAQVMEDQVLDKLMEGVPVTEKTMSYAELKGVRI